MDETELISTLQTTLSSAVSHPVKTSAMDDERPVPVVIIDDWDTTEKNFHNSPHSGEFRGQLGGANVDYERYLNFSFKTRVEFSIRHSDEVEVNRLADSVKNTLRLIRDDPQAFHEELKRLAIGSSGNPTNRFTEPKEAEVMLSARFHGDHTVVVTDGDQIEDLDDQFSFTQ